jgi:hypothetical protein
MIDKIEAIDPAVVEEALQPSSQWVGDTPEQAQLRSCLVSTLTGHDPATTVRICHELITLMRDQLMSGTATVRRTAAAVARKSMSPAELATASGQSRQTISRLLTEARTSL